MTNSFDIAADSRTATTSTVELPARGDHKSIDALVSDALGDEIVDAVNIHTAESFVTEAARHAAEWTGLSVFEVRASFKRIRNLLVVLGNC